MSVIYSNTVLNAQADAAETAIGAAPTLEIRAGTPPAHDPESVDRFQRFRFLKTIPSPV